MRTEASYDSAAKPSLRLCIEGAPEPARRGVEPLVLQSGPIQALPDGANSGHLSFLNREGQRSENEGLTVALFKALTCKDAITQRLA